MLLKKQPRTRLDLLKPNTAEKVEKAQRKQKEQHDTKAKARQLNVGDRVYVRNYLQGERWQPGTIIEGCGSLMFRVKLLSGRIRRCHQEQLRKRDAIVDLPLDEDLEDVALPCDLRPSLTNDTGNSLPIDAEQANTNETNGTELNDIPPPTQEATVDVPVMAKRYPTRSRNPVLRYEPGMNWNLNFSTFSS